MPTKLQGCLHMLLYIFTHRYLEAIVNFWKCAWELVGIITWLQCTNTSNMHNKYSHASMFLCQLVPSVTQKFILNSSLDGLRIITTLKIIQAPWLQRQLAIRQSQALNTKIPVNSDWSLCTLDPRTWYAMRMNKNWPHIYRDCETVRSSVHR